LFSDNEIPETLMDCSKFKAGLIHYTNLAGSKASRCRYHHTGEQGILGPLIYRDAITCTWAIETPPGTNALVQVSLILVI
jgi:hypothetical protein